MKQIELNIRLLLIPIAALFIIISFVPLTIDIIFNENTMYVTLRVFYSIIGFFIFLQARDYIVENHLKIFDIVLTIPIYVMLAVVLYTAGPVAQFLVWKNPKRVYSVGKTLCTILIFVSGVRVRIIGKRPPKNKQYVLVANHSSIWDEAGMTLAMGEEPYTIIFAEEIKRVPFIGGMLRKAAIPVDRDDPNSRTIAADKAMEEVRNGKNYAAYAEGKRLRVEDFNKGIIMYKFKLSAFKIACKFELDVYPVVFAFPYLYKPRSGQWWVSPREIKMICCDPISTKGKDPKEVAEETYVLMEATLRKELIKMGILN